MSRQACFALLASVVACFVLSTASVALARPPNVILVMTDDQGHGDVGAHGNSMIRTPNLDRLHGESVRLTDFHVDPTCSPTRSALMTGRYSTRTGVWHTIMGRSLLHPDETTLAEVFRANGYRTGFYGKWHLGDNYPLRAQDQGFDETFYHGGGGVGQGPDYWGNDYFDDTYFRDGVPEATEGYCTDVWFREATAFIEKNREKPFFCYLATNAPHGPYLVDPKYSEPYAKQGVEGTMAKFYGMIENIDENLGRLRARLSELGLTKNTIFIFMTDNGSAAGWRARKAAKWPGYNSGMRDGKGSANDGGHRVPFFVHWPEGKLLGGRDVNTLSAHIDVLPTLADWCGLKVDSKRPIDGKSLAGVLRGEKDETLAARTLFVHSQRIPDPEKWRTCSVMESGWRLVNGKVLHHIAEDPGQDHDVADEHPERVARMRAAYDEWWKSLEPVFGDVVRIGIGSEAEPVSLLHSHDWRTNEGMTPWNQGAVRRGAMGTGFWELDVTREGTYEIKLRRWPAHVRGPFEGTKASIRIGGRDVAVDVEADAEEAVFRVDLKKGPARLETSITLANGKARSSYFAYVKRLEEK